MRRVRETHKAGRLRQKRWGSYMYHTSAVYRTPAGSTSPKHIGSLLDKPGLVPRWHKYGRRCRQRCRTSHCWSRCIHTLWSSALYFSDMSVACKQLDRRSCFKHTVGAFVVPSVFLQAEPWAHCLEVLQDPPCPTLLATHVPAT